MSDEVLESGARHRAQPFALGAALHFAWLLERSARGDEARAHLRAFAGRFGVDDRSGDALHALVRQTPAIECLPGTAIVTEGEASDAFFVVLRGLVEVRRRGAGVLARLGPGQAFGEIGLLARTPRTATVVASGPTTVLRVRRGVAQQVATWFPPFEALLQAVYRDRLLAALVPPGSVFSTLDAPQRHALFARFGPGATPAGGVVLREGQEGVGFFVIVSGRADVVRSGLDRQQQRVASLGPGDFFGEISLLYELPVTADVRAVEPLTWLALAREDFHEVLRAHPEQMARVTAVARRRLGYERHDPVHPATMSCPTCGYDQEEHERCLACGGRVLPSRDRRLVVLPPPAASLLSSD